MMVSPTAFFGKLPLMFLMCFFFLPKARSGSSRKEKYKGTIPWCSQGPPPLGPNDCTTSLFHQQTCALIGAQKRGRGIGHAVITPWNGTRSPSFICPIPFEATSGMYEATHTV